MYNHVNLPCTCTCTSKTTSTCIILFHVFLVFFSLFRNKVLDITNGIDEVGGIKWDSCLTLLFAWCVVFACISKGIKSSGKVGQYLQVYNCIARVHDILVQVMYFTATSPYIFLIILLIRMSLLDGSEKGILFYLVPDFEKVTEMQV